MSLPKAALRNSIAASNRSRNHPPLFDSALLRHDRHWGTGGNGVGTVESGTNLAHTVPVIFTVISDKLSGH